MHIFIGNIPSKKYEPEIKSLINAFDSNARNRLETSLTRFRPNDYYCIVKFANVRTGRRFIKKLDQKSPFGQPLKVREYQHRSYGNERRAIDWREKDWNSTEKRTTERRAYHFQPELQDAM